MLGRFGKSTEFIKDDTEDLSLSCVNFPISEVTALDDSITYVGIYHNHASRLDDEIREDISNYFTKSSDGFQVQMFSTKAEKRLGEFQYAMARFDDAIRYTFSINEHDLLLVATTPRTNSDLVISRILDFLRH